MDLQVVTTLRDLAKVEANRHTIVNDNGCLPGLVLMLDNPSSEVVDTAIEALGYLAELKSNRIIMWRELGLVISLNGLVDATGTSDKARAASRDIIHRIRPETQPMKRRMLPKRPPTKPKPTFVGGALRRPLGNLQSTTGSRNGASFFKPNTNKNARTVTIQVIGLTDLHTRKILEAALLKLTGIVSFTIDMGKARVAIRALSTLSVEMITIGIQQTKIMSAQQIIKNEDGAEVVLSFGTAPAGVGASAPAANMPRYLDDEEENEEPDNPKTALQITDGITTGFTGFLSSAVSTFSSTFHW